MFFHSWLTCGFLKFLFVRDDGYQELCGHMKVMFRPVDMSARHTTLKLAYKLTTRYGNYSGMTGVGLSFHSLTPTRRWRCNRCIGSTSKRFLKIIETFFVFNPGCIQFSSWLFSFCWGFQAWDSHLYWPSHFYVKLEDEFFRRDPWRALIVYKVEEEVCVTCYRLSPLEFADYHDREYVQNLEQQLLLCFACVCCCFQYICLPCF